MNATNAVQLSPFVRVGLDLLGYGRQENVHDVLFFLVGAEMTGPFPSVVSSLRRCRRDRYVREEGKHHRLSILDGD